MMKGIVIVLSLIYCCFARPHETQVLEVVEDNKNSIVKNVFQNTIGEVNANSVTNEYKNVAAKRDADGLLDEITKTLKECIKIIGDVEGDLVKGLDEKWKAIQWKVAFLMKVLGKTEEWAVIKVKVDAFLQTLKETIREKKSANTTEILLDTLTEHFTEDNKLLSFEKVWGMIMDFVKHFVGPLTPDQIKILQESKTKLEALIKKSQELVEGEIIPLIQKVFKDILDRLIPGLIGTTVMTVENEEVIIPTFNSVWTDVIDKLKGFGKVGETIAKFLDQYKDQLTKTVHKVAETGLEGMEKMMTDIRDDIIKIIKGGHITE